MRSHSTTARRKDRENKKKGAAAADQVSDVLSVQQRVQELCCEVNGRLCHWNSGWFRGRQRGGLLFVLIILNQGWL